MSLRRQKATQRLGHLYEMGKLLALTENLEETFEAVFLLARTTLPLESVVAIQAEDGYSRILVWPQTPAPPRSVLDPAEAAYRYFADPAPETAPRGGPNVITLPLVVAHRRPFGAMQVNTTAPIARSDLAFLNAIANQLATALERGRAWRRDITRREAAEEARLQAEELGAITERRRAVSEGLRAKYEALAAENAALCEQARRDVRLREEILAVVSHDLRNPLTTILVAVSVLEKSQIPQERRVEMPRMLGRIQRAAGRMRRLIEDLLDFASIEAGNLAVHPQPEDPDQMLAETAAGFDGIAEEKRLQISWFVPADAPSAFCDRDRILQVLSNLVGNAVKATSAGGRIVLRVQAGPEDLQFSVADTGPGIREADVSHLFDRYWRGEQPRYTGLGLGLAIARGIVTAHGGRIWAESELGVGSTFTFTLPREGKGAPPTTP